MADATFSFFIDWNGDGDFGDTGENVTSRVLGLRSDVQISQGRDIARAMSGISPGEVSYVVNNETGDYSPDNAASPLSGNLGPGKAALIQATHNAVTYDLFRGYLDGYELNPGRNDQSASFTFMDLLTKVAEAKISTELYQSIQTGEAINKLLDAVGWPTTDRDIDTGATTIRWWWEEGTNGMEALKKIVESEGQPALAHVDPSTGYFVFRDRHHRLRRTESLDIQATFRPGITEPVFSDMTYEIGWRDLVNQVVIDVDEREPADIAVVWESEDVIALGASESRVIEAGANEPFFDAITPEAGVDYTLVSGAVDITLSRTSGQTTNITVTASSASVINGMKLRARAVPVARTYNVVVEDAASISTNGVRTLQDASPDYAGRNDAFAVASVIIGYRAERRPVVHITVKNKNDTRTTQILSRQLSDRIHIVEGEQTYIDHDFFIENIKHDIGQVGKDHSVTFGCERAGGDEVGTPNVFTFDTAGKGFNDGVFGGEGATVSSVVFILGTSLLGTGALGY